MLSASRLVGCSSVFRSRAQCWRNASCLVRLLLLLLLLLINASPFMAVAQASS